MDAQHALKLRLVVASALVMLIAVTSRAAEPVTATSVVTKKMCPNCAKKIVAGFRQIEGVADARADTTTKTFVVVPMSNRVLSPRLLWETVEQGGEHPVQLAGPSGSFDAKPAF